MKLLELSSLVVLVLSVLMACTQSVPLRGVKETHIGREGSSSQDEEKNNYVSIAAEDLLFENDEEDMKALL